MKNVSDGIVRGVTRKGAVGDSAKHREHSAEHTLSHLAGRELKFRYHKESINQTAGTREDLSESPKKA